MTIPVVSTVTSFYHSMGWEVVAIDERLLPAVHGAAARLCGATGFDWQALEQQLQAAGLAGGRAAQSSARSGGVALVPVEGILAGARTEQVRRDFRSALASDAKAIVLAIDSPGGVIQGIEELAQEIFQARSQKPIVAQVQPLAASAAYWLASQAHQIAATPTSELGSIGVFAMHADISKALDDMGVKISLVSAGKYKTEGSPFGPLGEDARAFLQSRVDEYYGMFVAAVARGRGVSAAAVRAGFGEGRVVHAGQALQLGMADRIATLEETLARLDAGATSVMPAAAASAGTLQVPIAANAQPIPASAEKTMEDAMDGTQENKDMLAQEQTRAARIITLANEHGCPEKAAKWAKDGKSVEDVQAEILGGISAGARPLPAVAAVEVTVDVADKREKGVTLSRIARALAACRGNKLEASKFALEHYKDPVTSKYLALSASTGSAGGFWVPDQLAAEIIELLTPMTAVRSLNPTLAPLPNGSLTLPKIAGGATASYIGEQQNLPKSEVTAGQVKLAAKKLGCVVPISNDLMRYASASADAIVRNDIVRALGQAEDSAFIRGTGTAFTPKGLRNWTVAANTFGANATVNLANVTDDLKKLLGLLEDANVRMLRPGWIGHPRSFRYLQFVRDGNGNFAFKSEIEQGRLLNYPFRATTLVPKNLGGGSDESELYFADFADVVIADVPMIVLEVSSEATYDDGGTLRSAFSRDETVVKMIVEHDLGMRHDESVAYMSAVKWS